MKYPFLFPMKKSERVLGIICIPVHAILLPIALSIVFSKFWPGTSEPYQTLVWYTAGFILVLLTMFKYLRASFSDLADNFWRAVQAIILAFAMYYVFIRAAGFVFALIIKDINPNSAAYQENIASNVSAMLTVSVFLAPIVEESLFRGALFGTIRQKSRFAAYVISAIVFGIYHMSLYMIFDFSWPLLLYSLQYLPASVSLAWCYERAGTIWAPITLHAAINLLTSLKMM